MPDFELTMNPDELVIGAEGYEEILQNVRVIIMTPKGSVPLDREFGVSWMIIDEPTPQVRPQLIAEVFKAVERYEPRARVTTVEWEQSAADEMDGRMKPRVQVEIKA